MARARAALEPALAKFTSPYLDASREDESWYWAAPILLDLESYGASTREWFARPDLAAKWTGAEDDEDEGSRWAEHVEERRNSSVTESTQHFGATSISVDPPRISPKRWP